MDNNSKYLISLISAFINKKDTPKGKDIDWNQVYKLSRIHSISGIVYLMAKKLYKEYRPNEIVFEKLKKDFKETLVYSAAQDYEMEKVIAELNKSEVSHIFTKGFVMKNYYPVKEMRTMGDIDFLIKKEDREKTHKLMLELGYESGFTNGEVWDYTKGTVHLEVHTNIMSRNIGNDVDYFTYFLDSWNHANKKYEGYTYELNKEYHFLYLLAHIAKHFDSHGVGIRMIMDIAMYLIYFKDSLNWNYIKEELQRLELEVFFDNIRKLCNKWFDIECFDKLENSDENFYEVLSEYIVSAGTFGFHERNIFSVQISKQFEEKTGAIGGLSLLKAYIKFCFPDYETMNDKSYYNYLDGRPILLPVVWVHRAFRCVLNKRKIRSFIKISDISAESNAHLEVFTKLGLKDLK
ncbi:hypothetical protein JOC70_002795 [Clostridium pascui]|uniref:nucleotidyltransferase domain-containing protein n=1 Tax=Clostridium pascui TaxID=46609 RepID=UPI00195CF6E4|nr:nucleotidyltransferase family protein [Clostridium pascui]MBM7871297.1 hypothetical protein [Clostridium pascui]